MNDKNSIAAASFITLMLVLPWLNPLTYGPTHAVAQWLLVWFGAAACVGYLGIQELSRAERTKIIAMSWLMAATFSACMGVLQYLGYASRFNLLVNFAEVGQAYANLRQRNQLATLLSIGLCALLWWHAQARMRAYSWFVGTLLVAAAAATGSRTGLLQLALLLALAFVWGRARLTMAALTLAYLIAAALLPMAASLEPMHSGILGRVAETSGTCSSRLTLWSNVLFLAAQKPWFGWGWGELDFAHFVTLYPGERFCEILGNAHNLPLHLAVELGVPFSLLICAALCWLAVRAKPWREQDATRQLAWSVLAVIGLHSLVEYPLWYGPFQLATVLAIWMLWNSRPQSTVNLDSTRNPMCLSKLQMTVAASMIVALSYASWDYWRISQIYLPVSQRAMAYREDTRSKIQGSWLFNDQVRFAELGTTNLTADNAQHINELAKEMLHFSPEASVVIKLIESSLLLGHQEEAEYYETRFRAAYPQEYVSWKHVRLGGKPAT